MIIDWATFLSSIAQSYVSMLPILNPVAAIIVYTGLATHLNKLEKKGQVNRAHFFVFYVCILFFILGNVILKFFAISIEGIKIAGGILIVQSALRTLDRGKHSGRVYDQEDKDLSLTPLAIPVLCGPGSMGTAITLGVSMRSDYFAIVGGAIGIFLATVSSWVILRSGIALADRLNVTWVRVLDRLMGFIILCVGVQFFISGVTAVLESSFK